MPPEPTHYEVLGVPRDARNTDIERAHQNLLRANQREDVPPDARRDARIREAYETLGDPARREAYDRSLVASKAKGGVRLVGASLAGAALATAAGVLYLNRSVAPAPPAGRPVQELGNEAARSVGRVRSIHVSGETVDAGLAFAIGENEMATTCGGLAPGAQIVVVLPSRDVPARLTETHAASGLCKLALDGAPPAPLALSGAEARTGDKVYAAQPGADGVSLVEGTVRQVSAAPHGRIIEAGMRLSPAAKGGPLLDAMGRVVGIASPAADGALRHVSLPDEWLREKPAAERAPARNVEPVDDAAKAASPGAAQPAAPALELPADRREEMRKKFRPDPTVPADL